MDNSESSMEEPIRTKSPEVQELSLEEKIIFLENEIEEIEGVYDALLSEQEELLQSKTSASQKQLKPLAMEVKRIGSLLETKEAKLSLYRKMSRRQKMKRTRSPTESDSDESKAKIKRTKTKFEETKRAIVPTNLPKFRQGEQTEEPAEFVEAFERIMTAHAIAAERYLQLLPLCLDTVDGQWLSSYIAGTKDENSWEDFKEAFIAHFQHPNAESLWQERIRNLRVTSTGVQRYTDQYIKLASRLGWNLASGTAVFQYKQGLPDWMLNSVSTVEAGI
jgi:hypothetical protein